MPPGSQVGAFTRRVSKEVPGVCGKFGVPNGPLSLLWWTRYPLRMFCDPCNEVMLKDWRRQGMVPGDQVPWFLPNQKLVWEAQTMDNLMREFDRVVTE